MKAPKITVPEEEPHNPRKKLDVLEGSFSSGAIEKEEYEKEKQVVEQEVQKFDRQIEEANKAPAPSEEETKKSSDKALFIGIGLVVLLFVGIISYGALSREEGPKTIEDLHFLNLKGKLRPSQGYVYNNLYSFITLDNAWYTQINSPKGTKVYDLALRYSPRELENITIAGSLDTQFFNNQTEFYYTFDPTGTELAYVAVAVADFNTHMLKVFEKSPIAACDRNETEACSKNPIITCENSGKLVLHLKESDKPRVYYNSNCIVVEGRGFELVSGVDRVLYNLYGMMPQ